MSRPQKDGAMKSLEAAAGDLYASDFLPWPSSVTALDAKQKIAKSIASCAESGQIVGIGSGTAAYLVLIELANRSKAEGLAISVVPSSIEIEIAATNLQLPLLRLGQVSPDWMVDGADEVDSEIRVLKGRGGALFKEKLLWESCDVRYLAIDPSKRVESLGSNHPLPIEVHPNGVDFLIRELKALECTSAQLRTSTGKDGPVISESGFLILDAWFAEIPGDAHTRLKQLPGVLETGLFTGYEIDVVDAGWLREQH